MQKTTNLQLPIYDNPTVDKFYVQDMNNAHQSIETAYNTINTNYEQVISTSASQASAEVVDARKGKANLSAKIDDIDIQISFLDKMKLNFIYGAKGDGVTDDTNAINSYINSNESLFYFPRGVYIYNGTKTFNKSVTLIGESSTLKTTMNNHDVFFSFNGTTDIIIDGIKFDDNLKGRTIIDVINSSNIFIRNCVFTGYSAEFGYYQTDSAIRLTGVNKVFIDHNIFTEFGNQYTSDTATLNRCITINDVLCKQIVITNNNFDKVNQAIIVCGDKIEIANNFMTDVHDNCLYILGATNINVVNNIFENKNDECIVCSGKNISIIANKINNTPNKGIAFNGNITNVDICDNIFDNSDVSSANFIAFRDFTYLAKNMKIINNTFIQPTNTTTYEYFSFGNVENLLIESNYINVITASGQRILYLRGTTATGVIKNHVFIGTNVTSSCVDITASLTSYDITFDNNELVNTRCNMLQMTIRNQLLQMNVGPYIIGKSTTKVVYGNAIPTIGTWNVGDTIMNTAFATSGIYCWTCIGGGTGGTWQPIYYTGAIQSRAGTPVGWRAPRYIGDIYVDTTSNTCYMGVIVGSQAVEAWKQISN
jgi:hypothetical protein